MNKTLWTRPRWLRTAQKALGKYWHIASLMSTALIIGCDAVAQFTIDNPEDPAFYNLTVQMSTNVVVFPAGPNGRAYVSYSNAPSIVPVYTLPPGHTNARTRITFTERLDQNFPVKDTKVYVKIALISILDTTNSHSAHGAILHTNFTIRVTGISQTNSAPAAPLPPVGFTNLASFGNNTNPFTSGVLGDGATTNINVPSSLIEGSDGYLYGVTIAFVGQFNRLVGNVVKFSKTGASAQELLRFDTTNTPISGYNPIPSLARLRVNDNGTNRTVLIGADQGTPVASPVAGRIFRFNEDGSGFQVLHGFQPNFDRKNGAEPATLTTDQSGYILGTTRLGGYVSGSADDSGLIFRLQSDGADFEVLRRFRRTLRNNNSGVLVGADGRLYGVGKSSVALSAGSIFTTDGDGGFMQENLYNFMLPPGNPGIEGPYQTGPQGGLVETTNGFLYGAHGLPPSQLGFYATLATNLSYYYRIAKDGTGFTNLAYLPPQTVPAPKSLVVGSDGRLYGFLVGTTNFQLIALHPDTGALEIVHVFVPTSFTTANVGGLVSARDGAIYGTFLLGGTHDQGFLFRYSPTNGMAIPFAPGGSPGKPPVSSDNDSSTKSDANAPSAAEARLTAAATITLSTNYPGIYVGRAVAIANDCLIVGVPFSTNLAYQGAAYVFRRSGTNWNLEATLAPPGGDAVRLFGFSAAIDSNTVVIGAPGIFETNLFAGAAYVFQRTNNVWQPTAKLAGLNLGGDEFGDKVGLHSNTIIVGAPGETNGGPHAGGAWFFIPSGSNWVSQGHITAPVPTAYQFFGAAVAINGGFAVVGAPKGRELDIPFARGEAHLFRFVLGSWSFRESLETDFSYAADYFGASVAMSPDQVVVGMPGALPFEPADTQRDRRGAIVFTRTGNDWPQSARLIPDQHRPLEMVGASVSFDNNRITVGGPHDPEFGIGSPGSAYVFDKQGTNWNQIARLQVATGQTNDAFGFGVAHSGAHVAVASLKQVNPGNISGAVHLFNLDLVRLNLSRAGQNLLLDWVPARTDFTLQSVPALGSTNWQAVLPAPTNASYLFAPTNGPGFYRLTKP